MLTESVRRGERYYPKKGGRPRLGKVNSTSKKKRKIVK